MCKRHVIVTCFTYKASKVYVGPTKHYKNPGCAINLSFIIFYFFSNFLTRVLSFYVVGVWEIRLLSMVIGYNWIDPPWETKTAASQLFRKIINFFWFFSFIHWLISFGWTYFFGRFIFAKKNLDIFMIF